MTNPFEGLFGSVGGGWGGLLDPRSQAMIGAAQALTQAGGPTRMPVSTGAALSGAMASASANYRQAQLAGLNQQMNKMKLQSQMVAMTQPTSEVKESNGRFVTVTTQPLYTMANGRLARNPDGGKTSFAESANFSDPFKGGNTGLLNIVQKLHPKIQDGSATPDEVRQYKLAVGYLGRDQISQVQTPTGPTSITNPGFNVAETLGAPGGSQLPAGQTGGRQVIGRSLSTLAQGKIDMQGAVEQKWEAYKNALKAIGPRLNPLSSDYKKIQSSYTAVLLALKDAASLGVLAGPDLDLLHSWLQDPTTLMAQIGRWDSDYLLADVKNIDATIGDSRKRLNEQFGIERAPGADGQGMPPGLPPGSKRTGRMFGGKEIWMAPDGSQLVAD
jgi:hypothetical protein